MARIKHLFSRLQSLWRSEGLHGEILEELSFHIDQRTAENIRRGMSEEEARREAEERFGNLSRIREKGYELRSAGWIEDFIQDIRYGLRMLRKSSGFTTVAVLTLALGIGANTAMFTVVYAVLIEPLPYPGADRLMFLAARDPTSGAVSFSYPDVLDWLRQTRVFENIAAYQSFGFNLTRASETVRLPGRTVSATFFSTLGIRPALGRDFLPQDDRPGSQPVVIITDRVWHQFFNADRDIVDRNVTLNGRSFVVIGVLPPHFQLYQTGEIFAPIGLGLRASARGERKGIYAIGRLRRDANLKKARTEANMIAERNAEEYPETNGGVGALVEPLAENFVGKTKPVLIVLFGAVTFVLLIACANLGNLLLARSVSRQKEIAVRIALGASRLRLFRQMLTENLLLALASAGLGLGLALSGLNTFNTLLPADITRVKPPSVDGWVLAFTLLVSVITAIVFGFAPARQAIGIASIGDVHTQLKNGGRGGIAGIRRLSLLNVLVAAEVALSLALLVGAGLMIRTLLLLHGVDPGFHGVNVLHTQIVLAPSQYTPDRQVSYFEQAIERVGSLPGVTPVSAVMCLPLSGSCWSNLAEVEGRSEPNTQKRSEVNFNAVAPGYFRALGIPLLKGRDFEPRDSRDALPVAIVSQSFVQRILVGEEPTGKHIRERSLHAHTPWATIVGVVGDVRRDRLDLPANAEVYFPFMQSPINFMSLVVRGTNSAGLATAIRTELHSLDPAVPVQTIGTMEELQVAGLATRQLPAILLGTFAALALLLALVGLYGVTSYSVSQRTNEIAIRMALGAQRSDVLWLMIGQGMAPVSVGLLGGLCIAIALSGTLSGALYGIKPSDPSTFGIVSLFMLTVALLACLVPARRASGVDPLVALRFE